MGSAVQRAFTGGEISPSLHYSVDLIKYATGLRTCLNFTCRPDRGVDNRHGTGFVAEVSDSAKKTRLIPFIFNTEQTYQLEFSHLRMRVVKKGLPIYLADKNITGVTQANPAVVAVNAHGYSNDDEVAILGVGGMRQLNNRNFRIVVVDPNHFSLKYKNGTPVDSTAFDAYTAGGIVRKVFEIVTPYIEDHLFDLKYSQSADVVTITHNSYDQRELKRLADDNWTLGTISFVPSIAAPTGLAVSGAAGTVDQWVVTTVRKETFEESLPTTAVGASTVASSGSPRTLTWTAVTNAQEYNIYKLINGKFGFIGVAGGTQFIDNGFVPDPDENPPIARNPFSGVNDKPAVVSLIQQRQAYANLNSDREIVHLSVSASFKNFTINFPLRASDATTFTAADRRVNIVRDIIDLGQPLLLTSGGIVEIQGDEAGIIRPGQVNPKRRSGFGVGTLKPLIVGDRLLYVQELGKVVREFDLPASRTGVIPTDLTIFAKHLFKKFTIVDWDYQETPDSVIWALRNDGTLLGLTYQREHEVIAWHRHNTDGFIECVSVTPEDGEHILYWVVRRTVNGETKRYIERMNSRNLTSILDAKFMDSSLSYDGRNANPSHTMTVTGTASWSYAENATLTSSLSFFSADEVGNEIHLVGPDGTLIRFKINEYVSPTVVKGKPHKLMPQSMRNVGLSNWARAVDELDGLWHLEGKEISVFADGYVVSSPYNPSYFKVTVQNGKAILNRPYRVIHAGLPYISDFETLDIDTIDGETLIDKKILVNRLTLGVEETRGLWLGTKAPDVPGDYLAGLVESKVRYLENYEEPTKLLTDKITENIAGDWHTSGRIFARQVEPLPASILATVPAGFFPVRRGG